MSKAPAKSSSDKQEKKTGKVVVKHAVKKPGTKAAKHVVGWKPAVGNDMGLMTAFHHMQRASVVISLMKRGTGEDLHELLERGVKLYRKAAEEDAGERVLLRAIGVLRAAEHLSLAGLYAAREKHRQKVTSPGPAWLRRLIAETEERLEKIEHEKRGKGADLFPVTVELLRQAEDMDHDAHLAFELAMAADALCFALEHGL